MDKFGTFKLKNAVFITFISKFYPRKRNWPCPIWTGFRKYSVSKCVGFSNYFPRVAGTTLP